MRVMLCGGTGFIGTALSEALMERGDEVWIVTRQLPAAPAAGLLYVTWEEWSQRPERWSGIDAIVNLAGETISKRWTDEAKRRILISRTQTALHIADIVKRMPQPPKVLVNASGISLYGHSYSPIVKPEPAPKAEKKKKKKRDDIGNWREEWDVQEEERPREFVSEADRVGIRGFTYGARPVRKAKSEASSSESDAIASNSEAPDSNVDVPASRLEALSSAPDASLPRREESIAVPNAPQEAEESDLAELLASLRRTEKERQLDADAAEDRMPQEPEGESDAIGSEWFDESSPPQPEDLLGRTVVAWEEAVDQIPVDRIVKLRTSLVLGRQGGTFPLLRLPYRFFVGGRMGSGMQGLPWIHLQDMISLILFSLDRPELSGPVNAVAPDPVNNDTFGRTLARVTRRPHWLPVPEFALRKALGEQSVLLLTGQHAYPRKALEHGFTFAFPRLEDALRDLTDRSSER